MIERAKVLKELHDRTKEEAQALLKQVAETNNLGYALMVMQEVEDLLPATQWIPDRAEFPLIRAHIDNYDHYRREGVYGLLDMFEEEIWYFVDATEEEQREALNNDYGWDPHKSVPVLWEIIKSGYGKFRLDW